MCKFGKKILSVLGVVDDAPTQAQNYRPAKKRALLVGINKYAPALNADLRGCVNDVENMHTVLINKFGFNPDDIRVLTDFRATKDAIIDRLDWLVDDISEGDELVFHYSGHGSQTRDRNGDELEDGLDEILCPTDLDWNNPLTDDYLYKIFKIVPHGVFLTMFCDACHSGSMTRGIVGNPTAKDVDCSPRYLEPPFDIKARAVNRKLKVRTIGAKQDKSNPQNHILISGCRDDQTSADAFIDGKYQGAFTWALTSVIAEDSNITFKEAHARAVNKLNAGFTQVPQLSGDDALINRKLFGM